jgi:hypothetical protein
MTRLCWRDGLLPQPEIKAPLPWGFCFAKKNEKISKKVLTYHLKRWYDVIRKEANGMLDTIVKAFQLAAAILTIAKLLKKDQNRKE